MNRHLWREVLRQLRESSGPGSVAVVMAVVATAWGALLLTLYQWAQHELLGHRPVTTVVAVLHEPAAAGSLTAALQSRSGQLKWDVASPAEVRQELAEWFPELANVLLSLDEQNFPALLKIEIDARLAAELATWLQARPEVAVVQSSVLWQARLKHALHKIVVVGFTLASILLAGCFLVVLLVVRLLVLDHTDEIVIMRLIGARETDIRLPYLALGFLLGGTGGALGVVVLASLELFFRPLLPVLAPSPYVLAAMPVVGAVAGAGGAALGLLAVPQEP